MAVRCSGTAKSTGNQCKQPAIDGGSVCRRHGGSAPQVAAKAAVRAELSRWRQGDTTDDPGETLLRLITQSRMRADLYSDLLQQAFDASERMAEAGTEHPEARGDAERDLESVLHLGGVAALVGKTYGAAGKEGHIFATGEAVRGLVTLESQERDRCARFCKLAIEAGLAERMVRIHERQAAAVYQTLTLALSEAGLAEDVRRTVMGGVARHLRLVAG